MLTRISRPHTNEPPSEQEQLARDLQALVELGLIELRQDPTGEWRGALRDPPTSARDR